MKKPIKILGIILFFIIIINIFLTNNQISYAADEVYGPFLPEDEPSSEGMTSVEDNLDEWDPTKNLDQGSLDALAGKLNNIIPILKVIGTIMSVGTLSIIGIKYMLSSVEEKAKYKQTMIPWVIGASFVFALVAIIQIIESLSGIF